MGCHDTNNPLRDLIWMPSPAMDDADVSFSTEWIDGNFLNNEPLRFRQEPSLEVDLALSKLADTKPVPLAREDILAIEKDPGKSVKLGPGFGLGPDVYAGRIDVFHQLHCLNALRQEAYFGHHYHNTYPGGYNQTTKKHRARLSHCIHIILQNILCHPATESSHSSGQILSTILDRTSTSRTNVETIGR
ncbi:hypothetical protein N8T08_002942 [Aspergillus melleus]|uniref:Uncharacterized protein n=1 Tax=Aspergillus melleus TaxID=138277 RepID=A0ACC3B868_9EURO|nr:hypothetical protein N8T08_002942 [Aspergillus melleus]